MNNWGNYMGMGQQPQMQQHGVKPLLPPQFMLPDLSMNIKNINSAPPVDPPQSLIGPVLPDNMTQEDMAVSDDEKGTDAKKDNTEDKNKDSGNNPSNKDSRERDNRDNRERDRSRHDRRSRDRDRDRGGNSSSRHDRNDRVSDRNRDRYNRNDRKDRSRDRDRRERRSKWDDNDKNLMPTLPNDGSGVMMPGMPGVQGMPGMGQMGQGMMPGQQGIGMGLGAPNMPGMSSGGSNMPGMGTGGPNMSGMGPGGPNMPGMGSGGPNMPGMGPGGPNMPGMGSGGPNMPGMGPGGPNMPGMGSSVPNMPGMSPSVPNMPGIGLQGGVGGQGMMPYGMQNMPNAGNMQNMGMMPGMNNMMMGNMMDPNMMMMNRPMMMPNQPIYVNDAMLLPPIAGNPTPKRRDKPPGCRTIFVGGLPKGVSEETISQMFESFGVISDIKVHRQGVCHVRFASHDSVEASFAISGYRYKTHDQTNNEATTLFVDYALNREDQNEFERSQRQRQKTPPRIEPYNPNTLNTVGEKIKNDEEFHEAAPTLIAWLEHGECNKRNANAFYSLIQASNNQVRRLFNEKMTLDEEFHNMKSSLKEKFAKVVDQFEQVAKILAVAKHQRVSDHFTKQQRRNIEMWLKMTEELENIKEEFNALFDDEETDRPGRNVVPAEKYEQLRVEHENLMYELEGYRNEAHLAKDEAERKFEKFKAHYIAQQALQGKGQGQQVYPPLPPPPTPNMAAVPPMPPAPAKPQPPPPTPDDNNVQVSSLAPPSEGKLISILTAFLMSHPLGASLDYMVSYVRSMVPNVTQATVHHILHKYSDVFGRKTSGIGANIEHRWGFVTFDIIKTEAS